MSAFCYYCCYCYSVFFFFVTSFHELSGRSYARGKTTREYCASRENLTTPSSARHRFADEKTSESSGADGVRLERSRLFRPATSVRSAGRVMPSTRIVLATSPRNEKKKNGIASRKVDPARLRGRRSRVSSGPERYRRRWILDGRRRRTLGDRSAKTHDVDAVDPCRNARRSRSSEFDAGVFGGKIKKEESLFDGGKNR